MMRSVRVLTFGCAYRALVNLARLAEDMEIVGHKSKGTPLNTYRTFLADPRYYQLCCFDPSNLEICLHSVLR